MGIVEMEIDSVRRGMLKEEWTIVLKERRGKRYLPILVSKPRADLVGRELLCLVKRQLPSFDQELRQKASLDLQLGDIETKIGVSLVSCKLESVIINFSGTNTFSAHLLLTFQDKPYEVDYSIAKALAFSVRAQAPIFADDKVLDKAAIPVSA